MKKLALALATTAVLGFAAPAFAADSDMTGTKTQSQAPAGQTTAPSAQTQSQTPSTQTPSAQTSTPSTQAQTPAAPANKPTAQASDKSKAKVSVKTNKAKMAHHRRGSTHLARHDRGFKHGRYYAYVKPHHKSVHHSQTMTH
jgi:hypothetical protein